MSHTLTNLPGSPNLRIARTSHDLDSRGHTANYEIANMDVRLKSVAKNSKNYPGIEYLKTSKTTLLMRT